MNVVDSSAWIEYFTDGPNAVYFAHPIERVDELIVPSICLHEVFKWVMREKGEADALRAIAQMQLGQIVELDSKLALFSARLGLQLKLPLADSIVLATAQDRNAVFWTQDSDFEQVSGVNYRVKVRE